MLKKGEEPLRIANIAGRAKLLVDGGKLISRR